MSGTDDIADRLAPLAVALEADGYELGIAVDERRTIRLEVRAGAGACAECLVPRDVFAQAVDRRLAGLGPPGADLRGAASAADAPGDATVGASWSVEILYPEEGSVGDVGAR